jgi:hypothetical protein
MKGYPKAIDNVLLVTTVVNAENDRDIEFTK